jgi:hypothetical protein
MDRADEQVNWSAVACRAFEEKLAEIALKRGRKTMDDVIQRLRASKVRGSDPVYWDAHAIGRRWAETTAEADQLERLERLRTLHEGRPANVKWLAWFSDHDKPVRRLNNRPWALPTELATTINPEIKDDDQKAERFWDQFTGGGGLKTLSG